MKHPTFVMALTGAALAASSAGAAPVRFDGPLPPTGGYIWFDLTAPSPAQPGTTSPSFFVLERYRAAGHDYVELRSTMKTQGSAIAASILGANAVIDESLDWRPSGQPSWTIFTLLRAQKGYYEWDFSLLDIGESGFVALSFDSDAGTHYGWVELRNISMPDAKYWAYEILAWGYETEAGVGIAAGAVPAPGALALLGCVGVAARRRRR